MAPLQALYVGECTFPSLGTRLQTVWSSPYHTGLAQQHHQRLHSAPRFPAMLWSPRAFASRSGGWPKGHLLPNLCSLRERSKRRVKRRSFAMWTAFPPSDYYGGSAPPDGNSRRRACPPPRWPRGGRAPSGGSHVHRLTDRRGRCPAMPLRPRHAYVADLRRGLRPGDL
jgi:hypothetical protein